MAPEWCSSCQLKGFCRRRGEGHPPRNLDFGHKAAFKEGQRFRAGIEGRISVLFRGRGMKRCLAEGSERFELLIGAARQ